MRILGIEYHNINVEEALKNISVLLRGQKKVMIFFLNADCLYKAQNDQEYECILNSADLLLSDGIGLRLATWLFGGKMKDNCNGTDFSPKLMECVAQEGYKVFFLGSKEGVAEKAAENVRKKIANIKIVGTHHGFFNNDEEVIEKINSAGTDILFVAMGVPVQEKWIARNKEKLNPKLCLGVGALFDYLSGNIARAPKFMQVIHLEWLWRIFIEPKRMFKRYIIDGAELFWIVLKQKFARS